LTAASACFLTNRHGRSRTTGGNAWRVRTVAGIGVRARAMTISVDSSSGKLATMDAQLWDGPWPLNEYDA
jgi:hypothetical protein